MSSTFTDIIGLVSHRADTVCGRQQCDSVMWGWLVSKPRDKECETPSPVDSGYKRKPPSTGDVKRWDITQLPSLKRLAAVKVHLACGVTTFLTYVDYVLLIWTYLSLNATMNSAFCYMYFYIVQWTTNAVLNYFLFLGPLLLWCLTSESLRTETQSAKWLNVM